MLHKTKYYDAFLGELHASGSEKAEGYTLANFDLMTEEEAENAFELLRKEFQYSSAPVKALFYIDSAKAAPLVKYKVDPTLENIDMSDYISLKKLYNFYKDEKYIDKFIRIYRDAKPFLLSDYISCASDIFNRKISSLLSEIILNEEKSHIRRSAAKALLKNKNIKPNSDLHEQYIKDLKNSDASTRAEALKKVNILE